MDILNFKMKTVKKLIALKVPDEEKPMNSRAERKRLFGRERMKRFRERKKMEGTYAEYLEKQKEYRKNSMENRKKVLEQVDPEVKKAILEKSLQKEREKYRRKKEAREIERKRNPYYDSPSELTRDMAQLQNALPQNRKKAIYLLKMLMKDYETEIKEENQPTETVQQLDETYENISIKEEVDFDDEIIIKEEVIDDDYY
jgi:hypothetical protein